MVNILLPHEALLQTKETILMKAPGFNERAKTQLYAGSNCLMVALLRGNKVVVDAILEHLEKNRTVLDKLMMQRNQQDLNAYQIASLCKTESALRFLKQYATFLKSSTEGDVTPLFNAVFFGNVPLLQLLLELEGEYSAQLYAMCLSRDSGGESVLEMLKAS